MTFFIFQGVLFINGINLGRYWPAAGPQRTNYIPKEILQSKNNRIILLELQKAPSNTWVAFSKTALLDD